MDNGREQELIANSTDRESPTSSAPAIDHTPTLFSSPVVAEVSDPISSPVVSFSPWRCLWMLDT